MTRKECYATLELPEGASLKDVKRAYRRMAFALHPDLNPDVPNASRLFQRLNEAYVLLTKPGAATSTQDGPEPDARAREEAKKAYAKADKAQGAKAQEPKGAPEAKAPPQSPPPPRKPAVKRPAQDDGIMDKVSGWFRKQIDDEQTLRLPGTHLVPGAKVRLEIRHGITGDSETVELTLPPEFAPGKAIRLKGMGKRLGKWRGDLYVRIEPQ